MTSKLSGIMMMSKDLISNEYYFSQCNVLGPLIQNDDYVLNITKDNKLIWHPDAENRINKMKNASILALYWDFEKRLRALEKSNDK